MWVFVGVCVFGALNAASYFCRSDGYGLPGAQDGIARIGWPFLMMERGGFADREYVSPSAAMGDLLVASIMATFALSCGYLLKRVSCPNA
jgi:hypothetical protein